MAECMAIELAELIEQGLAFTDGGQEGVRVKESPNALLELVDSVYRASALGLALIGRAGDPTVAHRQWMQVSNTSRAGKFEAIAQLLGVPVALTRLIEANHGNGRSARAIALNLRTGSLGLATGSKTVAAVAFHGHAPSPLRASSVTFPARTSTHHSEPLRIAVSRNQ